MRLLFLSLGLVLLVASGWLAFTGGAVEPVCRNIVYLHVPPAICSLVCLMMLFVCSIGYLKTGRQQWDEAAAACGEVGFVFATVLNVTGMIFARAEWGVWWTPSLRLISSALLWFLYVAYLILRSGVPAGRDAGKACAVFGIIAFVDVPLIFLSARFIRDMHRPGVSFETGRQSAALVLAVCGTLLLAAALIWIRTGVLRLKARLDSSAGA